MRGKRRYTTGVPERCRITPADAGKTVSFPFHFPFIRDHPRGCGENAFIGLSFFYCGGSPPRMRGKLFCRCQRFRTSRITPADAGKTESHFWQKGIAWDHPRGCGENCYINLNPHNTQGSPPRMRGKLPAFVHAKSSLGITPADAGKTTSQI